MSHFSRRNFLAGGAAVLAAPMFVPSRVFGANDRIQVGMIGVGRQGQGHCGTLGGTRETLIVAVCDVDRMSRDEAAERIRGVHRSRDKPEDVDLYSDYREILGRDDIDAVLISTPDHWHAIPAIEAARAGKDIYCEKPLSLTVEEAWAMVAAARENDIVFQTGSQQRSDARFRHACELVRNGYIGELKTVHVNVGGPSRWCDLPEQETPDGLDWDRWLGPAPRRGFHEVLRPPHNDSFPNWRAYREYSGGMMTDWGAHHFDIAQWALGMDGSGPVEIVAPTDDDPLTYRYASGVEMYHVHNGKPRGVEVNGVLFTGTEGTIEVNRGHLKTDPESLEDLRMAFRDSDTRLHASGNHHGDWIHAMQNRTRPICDVEVGASTATVCHLGNIAYWLGRDFKWDPESRQVVGDDEAAALLSRERRSPWEQVDLHA